MALLAPHFFEKLFVPLSGRRIGYFVLNGNVGDELSRQATRELFEHFGISFTEIRPEEADGAAADADLDELVISGGGNMGSDFYGRTLEERRIALRMGLPTTIFPQTFLANDEELSGYKRIFVRERRSLAFDERFELAPDLALGLRRVPRRLTPEAETGVFLRRDIEAQFEESPVSLGDPAYLCSTYEEYLELAASFEHIITDRLHFAIAGLLQHRKVSLLPNSYWKNRAVFDTWLRDFDCKWLNDAEDIRTDTAAFSSRMLRRLAGAPGEMVDWSCRPVRQTDHKLYQDGERFAIRRLDDTIVAWCDEHARTIWALCDGSQTTAEIFETLWDLYPENGLEIARDLQDVLRSLKEKNAVYLDFGPREDERAAPSSARTRTRRRADIVELIVEPAKAAQGMVTLSATLKDGTGGRADRSIWFQADESCGDFISGAADPFLLAVLMRAMRRGRDIVVKNAPVSPGLLGNLERFQQVWCRWRTVLRQVEIRTEIGRVPDTDEKEGALLAFSGGVDSCFTAYEYTNGGNLKHQHKAAGALMIRGFDIPRSAEYDDVFGRAFEKASATLRSVGLPLVSLNSNIKDLVVDNWLDEHGLMLGAALSVFKPGYSAGIIPSTMPYELLMPLGSNPISDPLMSSTGYEIQHHGSHAERMDKIGAVGLWPEALANLRVCWSGSELDRNCGRCTKCVLTHLGLWAHELEAPCFEVPLGADLVREALGEGHLAPLDWQDVHQIVILAQEKGLTSPWLSVLQYRLSARP